MSGDVSEIIRDLGRLEGRVTQLAETVDRNRSTAADGLANLNIKIDSLFEKNNAANDKIIAKVDSLILDKAQIKGAWTIAAWFGGIMVTIGALIASFAKYFWQG